MNKDNKAKKDPILDKLATELENRMLLAVVEGGMPEGKEKDIVLRTLKAFNRRGVSSMMVVSVLAEVFRDQKEETNVFKTFGEELGCLWDE